MRDCPGALVGVAMMGKRNILVEKLNANPAFENAVEIVERKGVGHPDSICDAVMEEISIALSREYLSCCGRVLHHNIDKGLLIAGSVERKFGGGRVVEPMRLIIGDRATFDFDGRRIPVEKIAVGAAKKWIDGNLRFVDPDKDFKFEVELKPGSPELSDIFNRKGEVLGANDTSAAVGYAPLSPTEKMVLGVEHHLNSSAFKEEFPEAGEDIKVMAYRTGRDLHLTVAMPLIDRFVEDIDEYFGKKQALLDYTTTFAKEKAGSDLDNVFVYLNMLDLLDRGLDGIYLSVTGTSAEDADSGEVGRGNRVNGVIALNRPMGTEAAAGKNPVSHVGKIYTILAHRIANEIYSSIEGIREVYVWLCSQIGQPIDEPRVASAQLVLAPGIAIGQIEPLVKGVIDLELSNIGSFTTELAEGRYKVW